MSRLNTMLIIFGIISIALASFFCYNIIITGREMANAPPPIDYLKNLPPKPDDWDIIKREISSGYMDIDKLTPAYWLQPDFYPNWDRAKSFYESHDYSRWGVYGHGAFPANPTVTFTESEPGKWIRFTILYKTGYGIETWQGIKLVPEDNEYFDVKITPDQFLLEPTFPAFGENWVKKLSVNVSIKKQPPKGKYIIDVYSVSPDKDKAMEWFWYVLEQQENTEYEMEMIERAKLQAYKEGKAPEEFINWVKVGRKNKYVDGSQFQLSPRISIEIEVK